MNTNMKCFYQSLLAVTVILYSSTLWAQSGDRVRDFADFLNLEYMKPLNETAPGLELELNSRIHRAIERSEQARECAEAQARELNLFVKHYRKYFSNENSPRISKFILTEIPEESCRARLEPGLYPRNEDRTEYVLVIALGFPEYDEGSYNYCRRHRVLDGVYGDSDAVFDFPLKTIYDVFGDQLKLLEASQKRTKAEREQAAQE